jgi:hypothetical protein
MMTVVSRRYLVFAFVGLVALAAARPMAQQTPRTVGTPGVEQLTVDFLAVAKDDARTPILDLTKETVTLKVGGKNRVITSLQLLKMEGPPAAAAAAAAPAAAPAASAFPPPFATNVRAVSGGGPGRNLLFIIDTETIRSGEEGPVRTAILGMVDKLTANDQVSVVAVPHGGMSVEMTSDIGKVRDAITHFTGAAPATETSTQATDRSRLDVEALTGILRAMSGADRPTTIIYVGSSLMGPGGSAAINSTGVGANAAASTISQGQLTADTFNYVRENIGAARAQIFVVQAESGPTISGASPGTTNQGLMTIAGMGGGEFYSHISLGNEDAVARIARTTSAYYVATFDADPSDKVNTRYPISLTSSRADVKFLVRPDFERTKAANNTKAPSTSDMLKTADPFRDLSLRMVTQCTKGKGPDGKIDVKVFAEAIEPGVKLTAGIVGIYDFAGTLKANYTVPAGDLGKSPLPPMLVSVAPGKYRVRFAATDGKVSGAVDANVDAELIPAGPLKLSGMVLQPKLIYSTEAQATAGFELYGASQGQNLSVQVDLLGAGAEPKPLEVKPAGGGDRYIMIVPVPIQDLPPGDYQVRATVGLEGQPSATITATLRKTKG